MNVDFLEIARAHWKRYPLMEPRDFVKLAYQSEFGPAHMAEHPEEIPAALLAEYNALEDDSPQEREPREESIGGGLCRLPITRALSPRRDLPLVARLFRRTMALTEGTEAGLAEKLNRLAALPVPGMEDYLEEYRRRGCPAVRHSAVFREAYHPHYRVLRTEFARFLPALSALEGLAQGETPAVAAIDGRCGSGKTGLGLLAAEILGQAVNLVHMDDFYLPMERRRENWMDLPAGNMDLERFEAEVLIPAREGRLKAYRPYDCRTGRLEEPRTLRGAALTIVEGTYAQHPSLAGRYDYKLFLTCRRAEQTRRLQAREGSRYPAFDQVWRPLEERYFAACGVAAAADLTVDTTDCWAAPGR